MSYKEREQRVELTKAKYGKYPVGFYLSSYTDDTSKNILNEFKFYFADIEKI